MALVLASDKEKAAAFREATTRDLEILKDLQSSRVPEFIKAARSFQSSLSVVKEAQMKLFMAWEYVANGVGVDNDFGSRVKEIREQYKELLEIDAEWDDGWDRRFIQPLNMTLIGNEGKRTAVKEAEIKKVASRFEKEVKTAESNAKKKGKKGDKNAAAEEYSQVLDSIEEKRTLILADLKAHCETSHFILLQAFCITMKEKMEVLQRVHDKSTALMAYIGESAKVQPDYASVPSAETMRDIYDEKRSTGSAATFRKPGSDVPLTPKGGPSTAATPRGSSGSSYNTGSSYNSSPAPAAPAAPAGPKKIKVQATWAFNAEREGELSMQPGDILIIHDNNGAWWKAELNGQRGNIPANYVTPYDDPDDDLPPPVLDDVPPPPEEHDDLPPPVLDPSPDDLPPPLSPHNTGGSMPAGGRGRGVGGGPMPGAGGPGPGVAGGRGRGVGDVSMAGRGRGVGTPAADPAGGRGRGRGEGGSGVGGAAGGRGAGMPGPGVGGRGAGTPGPGVGGAAGGRGAGMPGPGVGGAAGRGAGSIRSGGRGRGAELEPPPALAVPQMDLPPPVEDAPAPLPRDEPPASDWQQYTTPEGNIYYYNAATGESKWTL